MKKNVFLVMMAAASILMSSCSKQSTPYVESMDFYMLGTQDSGSKSVIYQNSNAFFSIESGYRMTGLGYADKDLYAAGEKLPTGGALVGNPAIWQNGQFLSLPISSKKGALCGLVSSGSLRYYVGYVMEEDGMHGVVLKNEELVYTAEAGSKYLKMGLGASGDIYAVGITEGRPFYDRISAANFTLVNRVFLTDEATTLTPVDIFVGYRDIVIACNKTTADGNFAYMWLDGQVVKLTESNSTAYSAALYNGYCHIGGSVQINSSNYARLWSNTVPFDYSYNCNPNSAVHLMYNSSYYLYQAIGSEGKVQICCNGALMFDVSVAQDFTPVDWCVIRK